MVDNAKGLEKMETLYGRYESEEISLPDFIDEFEKICFNDISGSSIDNFRDGWSKASVSTLLKVFIRAMEGDEDAQRRLRIDLGIQYQSMTIRRA